MAEPFYDDDEFVSDVVVSGRFPPPVRDDHAVGDDWF